MALQWNTATASSVEDRDARPHVLHSDVADVIVRVRGGGVCSGTPITGSRFVVTAAHCVLDANGDVAGSRSVVRDGVEYEALSVIVDTRYHSSPSPRFDAAVLVLDRVVPGPSASVADEFPTGGRVTLAGFQPLDTDGSLLRGTRPDNRPLPKGATGGLVEISAAPAGCVLPASTARFTPRGVSLPCGLIPGASGGGVFTERDGELLLVGVISNVAGDLSANGVVPLDALQQLLANSTQYLHPLTGGPATATRVLRS